MPHQKRGDNSSSEEYGAEQRGWMVADVQSSLQSWQEERDQADSDAMTVGAAAVQRGRVAVTTERRDVQRHAIVQGAGSGSGGDDHQGYTRPHGTQLRQGLEDVNSPRGGYATRGCRGIQSQDRRFTGKENLRGAQG